jgi:LPS-assembly protein
MPRVRRRLLLGGLLAALVSAALAVAPARLGAQPAPLALREGDSEVNIVADQMQQVGGPRNLLIAVGNVELVRGASRLLADRVELNRDTGDAVAQGRAVFFDGPDRLVGDRIDYNIRTGTGVVHNGSAFAAPYYTLSGERMERIGDSVYNIKNGFFTTCEGDDPPWRIGIGSATADLEDIVYGRDASFWVKNIPVFPWFPFFVAAIRRERQSGFLFPTFGVSSRKGFFGSVPYFWAIDDSQDLTVSLNTYTERGVGLSGEYRYVFSELQQGVASGFFLRESFRDGDDRGWLSLRHTGQITPRLSFKVKSDVTSDDRIFGDYGDRLHERSLQRAETNVFVSQRWDSWNLVANLLWYQDLTVRRPLELQRLPDVRLYGVRQPVPGMGPLLWDFEGSFVNFFRSVGPEGIRVDVHPRLYLPIPLGGVVTLTPFMGGRLTYYDQRTVGDRLTRSGGFLVEESVYDPRVRRQVELGLVAESRASRVYVVDEPKTIAAFQHQVEPRVLLYGVRGLDQKAFPQYEATVSRVGVLRSAEPNIDRLGKVSMVEYSITNRLMAKTVAGPGQEAVRWELARLTMAQVYDATRVNSEPFRDFRGDVAVSPSPIFRLRADAAYNVNGLGLREANADVGVTLPRFAASVGPRFNDVAPLGFVHAEVAGRITENLNGRASTSWDTRRGVAVEHRVGFDLHYQCWAFTIEYADRHRNEDEVRFSINLLGLGQIGTRTGTGIR